MADAKVVLQNGLGYDAFMTRLENSSPSKSRSVVTMADVLGVHGTDANPHLWYDVPRLDRIAGAISGAFVQGGPVPCGRVSPRPRSASSARSRRSGREVAAIRTRFHGTPVAYTEPVPGYLVAAAGLRNLAPDSFTRPIEEGTEPSPSAVAAMSELVAQAPHPGAPLQRAGRLPHHRASCATRRRRRAFPSCRVTETLPPHLSFQQWQLAQARALAAALAR